MTSFTLTEYGQSIMTLTYLAKRERHLRNCTRKTYPRTRRPSFVARFVTASRRRNESATVQFVLAFANASVAAVKTAISSV